MKRILIKTYKWQVTNNFGEITTFDNKRDAEKYQNVVKRERRVLNYIRPKGVTLVVSKDFGVFYRAVPAFLGCNGLPYAEAPKDKDREFFMCLADPFDHYHVISGDIVMMLKEAYRRMPQIEEDVPYVWSKRYGNRACGFILHPDNWGRGILWYNWDGENFSTNDKKCKITTKNFK